VIAFPFLWDFLAEYQQQRILCGFNPELDPLKYGYQALEGKRAIIEGGWFGQGLYGGSVYRELPASDTDFIFTTFCEKFGILAGMLLIAVMFVIMGRLLLLVRRSNDNLGAYICAGVIGLFIVQVLENIGMCLATLPVIGITLPFMSAGGSSTLSMYLLLGVVHCVSTRNRMARETQSQLHRYHF
jgi:rod shape determining protein RodA